MPHLTRNLTKWVLSPSQSHAPGLGQGFASCPTGFIFSVLHLRLKLEGPFSQYLSAARGLKATSFSPRQSREYTHRIRALASSVAWTDLFLARGTVLEGWLHGHLSYLSWPLWERKFILRVRDFLSVDSLMLPCWSRVPSLRDLSLYSCTAVGLLCQVAMLSYG